MRLLLCFLLALLPLDHAYAQALWGGTIAGMSIDDVKRLQPEASEPAEKPGRLDSGAIERLRLRKIEIEGNDFTASFYFQGEKLFQVTVAAADIPSDSAVFKYRSLTAALKSKYGEEISRKFDPGRLGTTASTTWSSSRTTVQILLFAFSGTPASIYLIYNSTLASTADKL